MSNRFARFSAYRAAVRAGSYAWPGGYPLAATMDDGGTLCPACLKRHRRDILENMAAGRRGSPEWRFAAIAPHYEGPALECDACGVSIESAYGAPDEADSAPAMVPQQCQQQQACAVTVTWRNDNPDTIHNRLAARLGREPSHAEATARVRAVIRGNGPGDSMLDDIEAESSSTPDRALRRVREWLEQFSVTASDASFARAAALRARLADSAV